MPEGRGHAYNLALLVTKQMWLLSTLGPAYFSVNPESRQGKRIVFRGSPIHSNSLLEDSNEVRDLAEEMDLQGSLKAVQISVLTQLPSLKNHLFTI